MKLEDQVCSLEMAKKLKELGVKQDSYFYWCDPGMQTGYHLVCGKYDKSDKEYSAFTVAELGEMLPFYLVGIGELTCKKNYVRTQKTGWNVGYRETVNGGTETPIKCDNTEANARAKMLIYLLENNLLSPSNPS